jgi:hypothetical protein
MACPVVRPYGQPDHICNAVKQTKFVACSFPIASRSAARRMGRAKRTPSISSIRDGLRCALPILLATRGLTCHSLRLHLRQLVWTSRDLCSNLWVHQARNRKLRDSPSSSSWSASHAAARSRRHSGDVAWRPYAADLVFCSLRPAQVRSVRRR